MGPRKAHSASWVHSSCWHLDKANCSKITKTWDRVMRIDIVKGGWL